MDKNSNIVKGMPFRDFFELMDEIAPYNRYANFTRRIGVGGQRIGQAFMNCLPAGAYIFLSGSAYDVFYSDDFDEVNAAMDYLIDNADKWNV